MPFLAAVSLIWSLVWLVLSIDICEQLVCDPAYVPGKLFIAGVKMVTLFSAWGLVWVVSASWVLVSLSGIP